MSKKKKINDGLPFWYENRKGKKQIQLSLTIDNEMYNDIQLLRTYYYQNKRMNPSFSFVVRTLIANSLKEYRTKGIIRDKFIRKSEEIV